MSEQLFELGNAVCTHGIVEKFSAQDISRFIVRHATGDFGDLCDEDKQLNNDAIRLGDDRILSAYSTSNGTVYVITEHDRSYTTVLLASEY